MKTTVIYRNEVRSMPQLPYPNAATRRELIRKALDILTMAAIGVGAAAILLFLIVLV